MCATHFGFAMILIARTLITTCIDKGNTNGWPRPAPYFSLQDTYTKYFYTCRETGHVNPFYYHAVTTSTASTLECLPTVLSRVASSDYPYAPAAPSKHNCQLQPNRLCSQQNTREWKRRKMRCWWPWSSLLNILCLWQRSWPPLSRFFFPTWSSKAT